MYLVRQTFGIRVLASDAYCTGGRACTVQQKPETPRAFTAKRDEKCSDRNLVGSGKALPTRLYVQILSVSGW